MSTEPQGEKPQGEKRIIIDEDWKSRVESEREAAAPQGAAAAGTAKPQAAQQAATAGTAKPQAAPQAAEPDPPLVPPDLTFVFSAMYMQALIGLGLVAAPGSDTPQVRLNQAQHAIDTLQMLRAKTEGNRTAEETAGLDSMLHELRLAFVAVRQQGAPSVPQE